MTHQHVAFFSQRRGYSYSNIATLMTKIIYQSCTDREQQIGPELQVHLLNSLSPSQPTSQIEWSWPNTQVKYPKTCRDQEMMPWGNPLAEQ